jgi:hypothetical protein
VRVELRESVDSPLRLSVAHEDDVHPEEASEARE